MAKVVLLEHLKERDRRLSLQEVEVLKRLQHPHVVQHFASWIFRGGTGPTAGESLVNVMEYCAGGDLRRWLEECSQTGLHLAETTVLSLFAQLLDGMRYVHSCRILHRDLKTSNMLLDAPRQVVKIGDFGIARVLETTAAVAVTMLGTPYYMSPEVCKGEPYRDKSDMWSLGCVLYEMCLLRHAFESQSLLGLVYLIVSEHYAPIPSDLYSSGLTEVVDRLLSKVADERPTAEQALAMPVLQPYIGTRPPAAPEQVPPPPPQVRPRPGAAPQPPPSPRGRGEGRWGEPSVRSLSCDAAPGPPGGGGGAGVALVLQSNVEAEVEAELCPLRPQRALPSEPVPPPPPSAGMYIPLRAPPKTSVPRQRLAPPPPPDQEGHPRAVSPWQHMRLRGLSAERGAAPRVSRYESPEGRAGPSAPAPVTAAGRWSAAGYEGKVLLCRTRRTLLSHPSSLASWVKAFALHDNTGRGVLSASEFMAFLQSLTLGLSELEVQTVTKCLLDENGVVSLGAFSEVLSRPLGQVDSLYNEAWALSTLNTIAGVQKGLQTLAGYPLADVVAAFRVSGGVERLGAWLPKTFEGAVNWLAAEEWRKSAS